MLRDGAKVQQAPPVYRPAAVQRKVQSAPPVYRPQTVAMRTAVPQPPPIYQPGAVQRKVQTTPPVYRPQTAALRPPVPPVYRPNAVQRKVQSAPPVYRPQMSQAQQKPTAVQRKLLIRGYEDDYDVVADVQALGTWDQKYDPILTHLSESAKTFVYENENAILNEVKTRYELIQAVSTLNELKSQGRVGYSGSGKRESPNKLPSNDWSSVPARHSPHFAIADDVSFRPKSIADTALNNLFEGRFSDSDVYLECESAMVVSHYRALQQGIGLGGYNKGITATMLDTQDANRDNIHYQLKNDLEEIQVSSTADLIPGDWVYITNYPGYADHVKGGAYSGENAIYEGNGRYSGFGLPNQTEEQMFKHLSDAYKKGTGSQHPTTGEQEQKTSETIGGKYPGILKKVHRIKRFRSRV